MDVLEDLYLGKTSSKVRFLIYSDSLIETPNIHRFDRKQKKPIRERNPNKKK
jgi:hypothetical protein